MKVLLSSALLSAALAAGCGASRVGPPPPPPAFGSPAAEPPADPPARNAEAQAPGAPSVEAARASVPAAAAPGETATSTAPQPPKTEAPPLGWIAGQPILAEELLLAWGDMASRELWLVIDKLVATRLALCEAERLGIRLAPEAVEQRFALEREKLQKEVARGGKQPDLDKFITLELGFEPARYLERVRRATIRQMLAERAVRAASLASESVALRLIVVADDAQKQAVEAALAAGRDFAAVAQELSVDDSKKNGGLVPFVVQDPRSHLARLAFQTPVGEVAGPLPVTDHHFWIRVEERRTPLEGNWDAIEAPVEGSLARSPVETSEFVLWKLTVEGRYPIDLGPLWSLIGAAK